jgi:hypothetical protein
LLSCLQDLQQQAKPRSISRRVRLSGSFIRLSAIQKQILVDDRSQLAVLNKNLQFVNLSGADVTIRGRRVFFSALLGLGSAVVCLAQTPCSSKLFSETSLSAGLG